MVRKLWIVSGGAAVAWVAAGRLGGSVPFVQDRYVLSLIGVVGIWAALNLWFLLPGSRRRYQVLVLASLGLAAALCFFMEGFGLAALIVAALGLVVFGGTVLIFGLLLLFRRKPSTRALLVPVTMVAMGVCGVLLSAWSAGHTPPVPGQAMSVSDELKYIYDTDQADRLNGNFMLDEGRDTVRLQRVKALYRDGQIKEPVDQHRAAIVYQHASCAEDYQVAYELAKSAADGGAPDGGLTNMAYDRWQMALGKPQVYGTQFLTAQEKRPCPAGQ